MAFSTTPGASRFTRMAVYTGSTDLDTIDTEAEFKAAFASATNFVEIKNIREFPALGVPPNIVNVPVYGRATSLQIQGQSDAPNFELSLNYVGTQFAAGSTLGNMVNSGVQRLFLVSVSDEETGSMEVTTGGLGSKPNALFFFFGKIEAKLVTPSLTDATIETITISVQRGPFGAYTI
jgi:hypothetical protein